MAVAGDVPHQYDIVIAGEGYMFAENQEVKAQYGFTPTFVPRQNVQGDYGDNFQDFWLTATQRDWSGGEEQRFFRQTDDASSRFWAGTSADNSREGQVRIKPVVAEVTTAANNSVATPDTANIYYTTTTNLRTYSSADTDKGAHGLGVIPTGICMDGSAVFMTSADGASVGVRKYLSAAFSTFSASGADAICFANNTLYGVLNNTAAFVRWDTAGTRSTVYQWKQADGTATSFLNGNVFRLGGKVMIGFRSGVRGTTELWSYDGTAPALVAEFPHGFTGRSWAVSRGVVFVGGNMTVTDGIHQNHRAAVFMYVNGTVGELWKGEGSAALTGRFGAAVTGLGNGIVIAEDYENRLLFYDMERGGVTQIGTHTGSVNRWSIASSSEIVAVLNGATKMWVYPGTTKATTATITSSLFDFDSSLDKIFRGVRVEFDAGSDGNGGSVDIAYRTGDVDGSYTTLQTGVTSGTEYTLASVTGSRISIKVTLNKGTSTNGPVLKKVAVRAVAKPTSLRKQTVLINCTGRDGTNHPQLRNGEYHPKDGLTQATALRTLATAGATFTCTDEFGTFTAVIDNEGFDLRRVRPNEFLAVVPVREV